MAVKEKSEFLKFISRIFEGNVKSSAESVMNDVVVPEVKNVISTSINTAIDKLIYKDGSKRPTNYHSGYTYNNYQGQYRPYQPNGYYNYSNSLTNGQTKPPLINVPPRINGVNNISDLAFTDEDCGGPGSARGLLETVKQALVDLIDTYGKASISDFYEYAQQTNVDPMSYNWGWNRRNDGSNPMREAVVRRNFGGSYSISLPPIEPIQ